MSDEKVVENRIRRIAERRGYVIEKSRRRDPLALSYDRFWVTRSDGKIVDDILEPDPDRENTVSLDDIVAAFGLKPKRRARK